MLLRRGKIFKAHMLQKIFGKKLLKKTEHLVVGLTLLHPKWPKLYGVLAVMSAIGLNLIVSMFTGHLTLEFTHSLPPKCIHCQNCLANGKINPLGLHFGTEYCLLYTIFPNYFRCFLITTNFQERNLFCPMQFKRDSCNSETCKCSNLFT